MSERTVIISVRGGVADIEQAAPGITVEIRDYDDCEAGAEHDWCDEEPDEDPQCVCGVYRSEHGLMGCPEGFQTKESWDRERDAIRDHIMRGGDYDDEGRPIYHYHDYDESDDDGDMEHYAFDDAEDDEGDR